ncbi:MAG: hypothetical protein M0R06_10400 [Sphaerochaeta sp.]|jgi:hypothetical protein|nr:hypothetical protein [Sphaerochaeta sp.]
MARNPQDINPEDSFPRRNLPDEAEKWGRSMEDRVVALEKAVLADRSSILGTNRNVASSLSNMTETISSLLTVLPIEAMATGFTVPSETSASVLTETITVPEGFTTVSVMVVSRVAARNTSVSSSYLYGKVMINGSGTGLWSGLFTAPGTFGITYPAYVTALTGLTPGSDLTVDIYAKADPSWESDAANVVQMSALAVFGR